MFGNRIIRQRLISFITCSLLLVSWFWLLVGCKGSPEPAPDASVPPPSPEVEKIYIEARELSENNKWEQCVSLLAKTLPEVKNPGQEERVLFLLAEGYWQLKAYEDAEELYSRCLTTFPKTEYLNEIIERKYQIGFGFFTGKVKSSLWGLIKIPATERGLGIIRDMLTKYPYAEPSASYQLKLGDHFYKKKLYEQAREEYVTFIQKYPKSPLLPKAQFQWAATYLQEYQGPEYDPTGLAKAKIGFQDYLEKYPEDEWYERGQKKLKGIVSKEAEREYLTGCYYLSVGKKESADIYFNSLINDYPETDWAKKAREIMAKPEAK